MKKLYLITLFLLFGVFAMAQTFQVRIANTDTIMNEGDTAHLTGYYDEMQSKHFEIDNLSDNSIDVKITREDIQLPDGMVANFCFGGVCYPPTTMESEPETVEANSTFTETIDVDLVPNNVSGEALIKITATKINLPAESISFFVAFHITPLGIANAQNSSMALYPNPVRNNLYVNLADQNNQSLSLSVYDAVGKLIKKTSVKEQVQVQEIDFSTMPEGIYMVVLRNDAGVITSKRLLKQ